METELLVRGCHVISSCVPVMSIRGECVPGVEWLAGSNDAEFSWLEVERDRGDSLT